MKPNFTASDIRQHLATQKQKLEAAILSALKFIGEAFVGEARSNGNYEDQTGNLRSSIGYMIFKNGQAVFESFPGSNAPAVQKAREVALQVAAAFGGNGFLFVGIAGMEYAAAVEAKGFDVITTSGINAEAALRRAMARLQQKVNRGF